VIRVVVVDDQELVRDGLVTLVSLMDGIVVAGTASDGAEAVKVVAVERPDVVLMDLRMPVRDGAEATAILRADYPDTSVLILTTYDDDESIARALAAGAAGYLTKDAGRLQLENAIRAVAGGQWVLAASVAEHVLGGFQPVTNELRARRADRLRARWPALSAREAEVAEHLLQGRSNPEIAAELFISVPTVKSHINGVFAKLGVTDRASAIATMRVAEE
jgi:DNA-binding NarL/FixJ family response regulator